MINIYLSRDVKQNKILFYKISQNIKEGKKSYYFVPDQYTLFSDINLIEALDTDVLMDVKVKSFSSFSSQILSSHGGIKKKILSEIGKNMLIKNILLDKEKDLKVFNKNIRTRGFAEEVSRSIKDLKDAGISNKDFEETVETIDGLSRAKMEDLSLIYGEYENKIKDKYIDTNDRLSLLAEKLEDAKELEGIDFFFDKYNSLNKQELEIVRALETRGAVLHFFLIMDPVLAGKSSVDEIKDGEVFEAPFGLLNGLTQVSKDINIFPLNSDDQGAKTFLANNLFSYKARSSNEDPGKIYKVTCQSTEAEVSFLVELIRTGVLEKESRYRDFTVICTNEEEYRPFIKRIFTRENIPFFLDEKKPVIENKLASFIISSLFLIIKDFKPEDVLAFLKFVYQDQAYEKVEVFEKYILSRKIRGSMFFNDKYFTIDEKYLKSKEADQIQELKEELEEAISIRNSLANLVVILRDQAKKKDMINNYIKNFFNFLNQDEIKKALDKFLKNQEDDERLRSYNEQTWEYFIKLLDELSQIQGQEEVDFKDFASILISGFEEESIGLIPPYQDVVFIGSTNRSRVSSSKNIIILGLVDNYFPKVNPSGSLIEDSERLMLIDKGLDLGETSQDMAQEEILNLYSFIQRADERLYISAALTDSSNTNLTESLYYKQLSVILPKITTINWDDDFTSYRRSPGLIKNRVLKNLDTRLRKEISLDRETKDILSYLHQKSDSDFSAAISRLMKPKTGLKKPRNLYKSSKLSISRIENFARCPYKHYVAYGLKPEEDLSFDIESKELGTIAHRSISSFVNAYKKDPERYKTINEDDFRKEIYEILEKDTALVIEDKRLEDPKNRLALEVRKDMLFTGINNLKRQLNLSTFTPIMGEEKFGEGRKLAPVRIDLGNEVIDIEGIIDRVDIKNRGDRVDAFVVDYKTGNKVFSLDLCVAGIDIQLPIYLRAVEESNPKYRGVGFFYLPITDYFVSGEMLSQEEILEEIFKQLSLDGIVLRDLDLLKSIDQELTDKSNVIYLRSNSKLENKYNLFTKEALDKLVDEVLLKTKENIIRLYKGDIRAYPMLYKKNSNCTYCEYSQICKFDMRRNKEYSLVEKANWKEYRDE